ncbi:VCBS repeat-containing protein [Streptomyces sp. A7024]|uniref:VCBS repeat-containing protein n=1 Tax=Streptomyces coryli TaxID=1128680 RepID=A0A6G4TX81_9ACTN|nr:VCBS repeat-containing protein [Streptomyces coryli]
MRTTSWIAMGALVLGSGMGVLGLTAAAAAPPGSGIRAAADRTDDFNGDGRADLVAGTATAAANGLANAGTVTVVPGAAGGPAAGARKTLTQDSPGVPGASEANDLFGAATAWGDVNGDGTADLIVGAPGENSVVTDRGGVTVLTGPGLSSGTWHTIGDSHQGTGARFGSAVAAGDFNGDGRDDVFAAGEGREANGLWWVRDSASGDEQAGDVAAGEIRYADAAAGDFNRDGYDDVVLNYRDESTDAAKLALFKGTAAGLDGTYAVSAQGGRSVASGDVNGDSYADLVVGQPYTAESGAHSGGQVTAVYGSANGLGSSRTTLNQESSGVPGTAEAGDALGASLGIGDVNADGRDDILAGSPGEDLTRDTADYADAGTALLLRGSTSGLTGSGGLSVHQDAEGVSGAAEAGDQLGSGATLADFAADGRADLAVGVGGEDAGNGTVLQLDATTAGVSLPGAVYYGVSQLGTPAGARLGDVLAP